jgi:nitrate reductase NapAB chaperone NapD
MSILGVIVRTRPAQRRALAARVAALPGVELAVDPGDGRLVLVVEDAVVDGRRLAAAATMAEIATWPDTLSTSLVYEHSDDEDAAASTHAAFDFRAWRGSLARATTNEPRKQP